MKILAVVATLYSMGLAISAYAQVKVLYLKVCNSSMAIVNCADENSIHYTVATIVIFKSILQHGLMTIPLTYAGPWSDSHDGRARPLLHLSIFGQILTDGLCLLYVVYWQWPIIILIIAQSVTSGLFGSFSMFWSGVLGCLSKISTKEIIMIQYGDLNSIATISFVIGIFSAGVIDNYLELNGTFGISFLLNVINYLIVMFFIKDVSQQPNTNFEWLKPSEPIKHYLDVFKGNTRIYNFTMVAMLFSQAILMAIMEAEYLLRYLFFKKQLNWSDQKFIYLDGINMMMTAFGCFFSIHGLSQRWKLDDAVICSISCVFNVLSGACHVFINKDWQYIIPFVNFFHGTALTMSIVITYKMVDDSKIGRLNSLRGVVTTLMSMVIIPMYSILYGNTLEIMPGAVFILSIALNLLILPIFVYIFIKCRYLWAKKA